MRELIAAVAARLGEHAGSVLDRVGGVGVTADRATRARVIAAWRAPVPPNLRAIHATWIEAALAELPARARDAVASYGLGDPVDVWLARWACAAFPPMPAPTDVRPRTPADVAALVDPVAWLADVGLDQLALALASAGAPALAKLGGPIARAAERIAQPPRAGKLGPVRAAIARSRMRDDDDLRYLRIGARAIAPHVDALARRQLVLRMPREVGLVIEDELRARAGDSIDQAPTWGAIAG